MQIGAPTVPEDRHIVLIGMMGAGKTTVGRLLADRLSWKFWDNDEALRAATGQTAADVQEADGQDELHRLEHRLLHRALTIRSPTVFAASGSIVLEPDVLGDALVVWLRISAAREAGQLAGSGQRHRPLPADPTAVLQEMGTQREPLYSRLADITVDTATSPEATCDRVFEALNLEDRDRPER